MNEDIDQKITKELQRAFLASLLSMSKSEVQQLSWFCAEESRAACSM